MVTTLKKNAIEQSTKPMIIMAFATWCPHCAKMEPIFEELEKELGEKYDFAKFDVDQDTEFTKSFQIQSLPTFIFLKNKNEVARELGEMPKDNLLALIEQHLN